MTYEELLGWMNYFERRPVEWRSDDRVYKVLQTQGVEEKPWQLFNSLGPIYQPPQAQVAEEGMTGTNFKKSYLFSKLLSAKGGDTIPL